jgi:REP element-mobilizing transposase RayT
VEFNHQMRLEEMQFFDPRGEIEFSANRLPHWQQVGGVYFVSFRLGDAVPRELLDQWLGERTVWLQLHPAPWSDEVERDYHSRFSAEIERRLDAGHGACVLRDGTCAAVVAEVLRHFEGTRCQMFSWVIMPNHVHVLFTLMAGNELGDMLHAWRLFSARKINEQKRTTGPLWQRDYFDRLVRDAGHFARCVRYIRGNPAKARLREGEYLLWESEVARTIE